MFMSFVNILTVWDSANQHIIDAAVKSGATVFVPVSELKRTFLTQSKLI